MREGRIERLLTISAEDMCDHADQRHADKNEAVLINPTPNNLRIDQLGSSKFALFS
jgi:hypothetical protein